MRFLLAIILIATFAPNACAVEIYAAGKRFDSFEEYQKVEKAAVVPLKAVNPIPQADPVAVAPLDPGEKKMKALSYDNGVSQMVVSFEQNWQHPRPKFISPAYLEKALRNTLQDHKDPSLLISESEKVRILSFHSEKDSPKSVVVDKIAKK